MSDDWKEKVLAAFRENRRSTKGKHTAFGKSLSPIQLQGTERFVMFADRAARQRGVNRSSFYRRAIALLAAHDLGIDVRVILWESPKARPYGEQAFRGGANAGARDLGEGIEDWCPHPGCDGEHLQPDA